MEVLKDGKSKNRPRAGETGWEPRGSKQLGRVKITASRSTALAVRDFNKMSTVCMINSEWCVESYR
jgi:hypothetical protein